MGPVFLFDVGVVLFVVGAAAGELDGFFSLGEVAVEVVVKEFGAVIAVEAEEGEGERFFDILDLFQDTGFSFAPDGSLFGPAGGDIDAVDGVGEHAGEGFAAVGDGIGFEEAGAGFIPLVGFDGDLVAEEGSGFGGGCGLVFCSGCGWGIGCGRWWLGRCGIRLLGPLEAKGRRIGYSQGSRGVRWLLSVWSKAG